MIRSSSRAPARVFAVGAVAALCALSAPARSLACSICLAGDPIYSNHGASALAQGELSLFAQLQLLEKRAGALPHHGADDAHEERTESAQDQRLDLYLAWAPLDRVTLTLDLPFAFNELNGEHERLRANGVGDVSLSASIVALRDRPVLPSAWLEARAFVKSPTGDTERVRHGELDPHLQPGTGSWDYGFGVAGAKRFARSALYASAFYRRNGTGDFGHHRYRYGDIALATLATELPVGHAFGLPALERLTLGAQLDFRWAEPDRADGELYHHSGGSILFATPSLRVRLPLSVRERPMALRAAVQIPLTNAWLNGIQREDEVWSLGIHLPL
jgi:hypothetical protein